MEKWLSERGGGSQGHPAIGRSLCAIEGVGTTLVLPSPEAAKMDACVWMWGCPAGGGVRGQLHRVDWCGCGREEPQEPQPLWLPLVTPPKAAVLPLALRTFSGQFQHWHYVPGPASGSLCLWPSGSLSTPCTGPSTREPEVIIGSDVGRVAVVSGETCPGMREKG